MMGIGGKGVGEILVAIAAALLIRLFSGPGPIISPENELDDENEQTESLDGGEAPVAGEIFPVSIQWSSITCSLSDKSGKTGKGYKRKYDTSSKRYKSGFEQIVKEVSMKAKAKEKAMKESVRSEKRKNVVVVEVSKLQQSLGMKLYLKTLPAFVHPIVADITEVTADGHCGFTAVAHLLGMGYDGWKVVRRDLMTELTSRANKYLPIFSSEERLHHIHVILNCFTDYACSAYWMTVPDMGYLIASCYRIPLVLLSTTLCMTFFPLWTAPDSTNKVICIAHVNGCHFVPVSLIEDSPIPSLTAVWKRYRDDCAAGWPSQFAERSNNFNSLNDDDKVITEDYPIINLD